LAIGDCLILFFVVFAPHAASFFNAALDQLLRRIFLIRRTVAFGFVKGYFGGSFLLTALPLGIVSIQSFVSLI
jgi:hypothetical protein